VRAVLAKKEVIPKLIESNELYRYSPGQVEFSSKDRGWDNMLVTRFVYDAQYMVSSPRPATPDHAIVLIDAGHVKGHFSYNLGRYRPCKLFKGDWIIGQAFENHFDGFGDILRTKEQAFATLVIHLSPKLLIQVAGDDLIGVDSEKLELRHQVGVRDPLMTQLANALKAQLYHGDLYGKAYAESVAHLLAVHLLQNYCAHRIRLPEVRGRYGSRMTKVLDYIRENMHDEISIESLAKLAHMSPYYFIKWFKKQLGETPYQFVVRRRMEKAKYLLRNTDKSVVEIALEIGYDYACNFSNAFKQYAGITPNSYRKSR